MLDRDTWQEILGTIRKHKLRTALTALGVFWGIFMLVFVLGMGKGLENGVFRGFGDRAKNVMYVWPERTSQPYRGFQPGRRPQLRLEDITAIRQNIPEVQFIAPRLSIGSQPVYYKDIGDSYEIRGELQDMIRIEALKLHQGRYINELDIENSRKVAVLGERTAEVLFGEKGCIGQYIRIKGVEFRVVGVFGPMQVKPWTERDMEAVVIPLTAMYRTFGTGERVDYFICSAAPDVQVSTIEPKVRALLKKRHHVAPDDPQGIGGFNLEAEYQSIVNLFGGIRAFLWFVGIGTLLAGIVGVSNIMLITVKERTKEIGIRKAMGATPRSVVNMVLAESIAITSVSGYLGLIAGTFIIGGINYLMISNNLEPDNFYNPQVNFSVGMGAILLLILAGAAAGFIPAMQAARVNPVVALRDE
ncbi:MAG: ABC transporter permease [Phaeodactylibacter sp.]|nr:ABC transporter permease [Phaeodactylibacter sp.]MCB9265145.1 ABC transporter permease [Lewinellaceae bacterium]MCB9290006.1 ABC transporter permease [Lewinellaceae bacterium]